LELFEDGMVGMLVKHFAWAMVGQCLRKVSAACSVSLARLPATDPAGGLIAEVVYRVL